MTNATKVIVKPRLLLIPEFTELEWEDIRPRLEEWAEVASFDPPGVGDEPRAERLDRQVIVSRGLQELNRLAWERYFLATDTTAGGYRARWR